MKKRILVVDDDPNIRRLVVLALTEDSTYLVDNVSSAEAALLHISRQPVDLLFTDIRMPGMNGLELVKRVHDLDPQTRVIVFTVSPQDLSAERAAQLKIDCLLEKPVGPDKLRLAVDLLLDPQNLLADAQAAPSKPAPLPKTVPGSDPPEQTARGNRKITRPLEDNEPRPAPIAMHITPGGRSGGRRSYSDRQLEEMRMALKELVLSPDVHCALLADTSGMVLTHWSRYRDFNVHVVAALAAGNSHAMSEISRNLGQNQPGHIIIQEGQDQSILMAQMEEMLLLLAVGPNASLGWARISTLRACEEVLKIARRGDKAQ
jgi:CheY-like chemotaxis protein/predicted regulator of Ras-like GTPase activity (Roadblock/LC7/MglB family)